MAHERERAALFGGGEAMPDLGVHLQHVEQVGRDRCNLDFARVSGTREVVALRGRRPHSREVL